MSAKCPRPRDVWKITSIGYIDFVVVTAAFSVETDKGPMQVVRFRNVHDTAHWSKTKFMREAKFVGARDDIDLEARRRRGR